MKANSFDSHFMHASHLIWFHTLKQVHHFLFTCKFMAAISFSGELLHFYVNDLLINHVWVFQKQDVDEKLNFYEVHV